jgi:pimeloyl-ACP methyl ester carboxylesterase
MPLVEYTFDGDRFVDVREGTNADRPLVLLLHGARGNASHMTDPTSVLPLDFDNLSPLKGPVDVGSSWYPGVGVWSCCQLDDKLANVTSWRDVLSSFGFGTAVYTQVEPDGKLEHPVAELFQVMQALTAAYRGKPMVVLAHSRGGLLTRSFLKSFPKSAEQIHTVITLHSPHTGSELANVADSVSDAVAGLEAIGGSDVTNVLGWLIAMARSEAFVQMATGSAFLTDLAADEQALPWIKYFTFGGVSVRLSRVIEWVYTLDSAIPQFRAPPYEHRRVQTEVPGVSPIADSLPNIIPELTEGRGDLLTADARTRLPFATHQTNPINHAEALWDAVLEAQVLRILGVDVSATRPGIPSFWG